MTMPRLFVIAVLTVLFSGCASNVPRAIQDPVPGAPEVAAVTADPAVYRGRTVRWGGAIARVENRDNETVVEIVAFRLDAFGEPIRDDRSAGRFLARKAGFLDPQIYARDRMLTVVGTVEGVQPGKVGEQVLSLPVVNATEAYLWPRRLERRDNFWCDHGYWGASPYFRYRYPGLWGPYYPGIGWRHPGIYPYGLWDPFWGSYYGPGGCRW
jgi:outer membrane lipoprotein